MLEPLPEHHSASFDLWRLQRPFIFGMEHNRAALNGIFSVSWILIHFLDTLFLLELLWNREGSEALSVERLACLGRS